MTNIEATVATDFRAPESVVDGVKIGKVLSDNSPGDKVSMKDHWQHQKDRANLVSPLNHRKSRVMIVGTGLADGAAVAALGELGYDVKVFIYHDAPRRAHSIAVQGGVNSARGKKVDNDGAYRYVKDTVKGGDYRCRENDCWRLVIEPVRIIDHPNAIGAPFAREYGGILVIRSFGGVQIPRTYYTRGQTGQQLQLSTTSALQRQIGLGNVEIFTHGELVGIIVADGRCQGAIMRNLVTGELTAHVTHAVIPATGGYGNVYHMSMPAKNSSASAIVRTYGQGAYFASPSFIQFHPTGLPANIHWQSKTILISKSLCGDTRIWIPKKKGDECPANDIPEDERDYFLERCYPASGNPVPRDVASCANSQQINTGYGAGPLRSSIYLDLRDAIERLGQPVIKERYSNLIQMYEEAIGEDPYKVPMCTASTCHFIMGGLWFDPNQMTSIPGLFTGGEASWTYHGANRLGASSLLSGLVDGWFTLSLTIPNYSGPLLGTDRLAEDAPEAKEALDRAQARLDKLMSIQDKRSAEYFHCQLDGISYRSCGVACNKGDLARGIEEIRELRKVSWSDLFIPGELDEMNQQLKHADRVVDYTDLGELMCVDVLDRDESYGAHYRGDHTSEDGEAERDDANWCFVSVWE